jgi:hypothetical protein
MNEQLSSGNAKEINMSKLLEYELGGLPVVITNPAQLYDPLIAQALSSNPQLVPVHVASSHGILAHELAQKGDIPSIEQLIPEHHTSTPITFDYSTLSSNTITSPALDNNNNHLEDDLPIIDDNNGVGPSNIVYYTEQDVEEPLTMKPVEIENEPVVGLVTYENRSPVQVPFYSMQYSSSPGVSWYDSLHMRLEDRMNMTGGYNMNLARTLRYNSPYNRRYS